MKILHIFDVYSIYDNVKFKYIYDTLGGKQDIYLCFVFYQRIIFDVLLLLYAYAIIDTYTNEMR